MNAKKQKNITKRISLKSIQKLFFRTQLILILSLALILGVAGTLINVHFETEKRDQNLQNVAEAIANSPMLTGKGLNNEDHAIFSEYLDTLRHTCRYRRYLRSKQGRNSNVPFQPYFNWHKV